jgi:hypothetical protein
MVNKEKSSLFSILYSFSGLLAKVCPFLIHWKNKGLVPALD